MCPGYCAQQRVTKCLGAGLRTGKVQDQLSITRQARSHFRTSELERAGAVQGDVPDIRSNVDTLPFRIDPCRLEKLDLGRASPLKTPPNVPDGLLKSVDQPRMEAHGDSSPLPVGAFFGHFRLHCRRVTRRRPGHHTSRPHPEGTLSGQRKATDDVQADPLVQLWSVAARDFRLQGELDGVHVTQLRTEVLLNVLGYPPPTIGDSQADEPSGWIIAGCDVCASPSSSRVLEDVPTEILQAMADRFPRLLRPPMRPRTGPTPPDWPMGR